MNLDREWVWILLNAPVTLLWQLGGTVKKQFRRIGVPLVITLAAWLFLGWSWWWLALAAAYFGVTTLPFTLIGDGVPEHWFNWIWIWILGALYGAPAIIIGIVTAQIILSLWLLLVPMVAVGVWGTLSNVKATAKYFTWKFCEGIFGFATSIPPSMLIFLAP